MTQDERDRLIAQAEKITRELAPVLARMLGGQPVEVQGMVVADLTAIWLTGHFVPGNAEKTRELRETLLVQQVGAIRALVEMYSMGR